MLFKSDSLIVIQEKWNLFELLSFADLKG